MPSSTDVSMLSYIFTVTQMLSNLSLRVEQLEDIIARLSIRVFNLEMKVRRLAHPTRPRTDDTTHLSDLIVEVGRLRGLID